MLFMLDSTPRNRMIGLAMTPEIASYRKPLLNGLAPSPVFDPEDRLLTCAQAAELSGVDHTFIRKAVRGRELRAVILGPKTHRIRLGELQRWWKAKQMIGFTTSAFLCPS
jgi:excisionase family DNA binding protein